MKKQNKKTTRDMLREIVEQIETIENVKDFFKMELSEELEYEYEYEVLEYEELVYENEELEDIEELEVMDDEEFERIMSECNECADTKNDMDEVELLQEQTDTEEKSNTLKKKKAKISAKRLRELIYLAMSDNVNDQMQVSTASDVPPSVYLILAQNVSAIEVLFCLYANPRIPIDCLVELAGLPIWYSDMFVRKILNKLKKDRNDELLNYLKSREDLPEKLREALDKW